MRNTNERLGGFNKEAADQSAPSARTGDLNFAVPTEFVELPSKGKFYPPNHPLHEQDSVEIRYMTAKEEDILSSKTLIKKGIALERLLQSVLVDPAVKTDDLLIGDKNAILIATRITGYGDLYETKVTCPSCEKVDEFAFNLNDAMVYQHFDEELLEKYSIQMTDANTFKLALPTSKVVVEFALLKGSDEKKLTRVEMNRGKKSRLVGKTNETQGETRLTDQLKLLILSVNGNEDRSVVSKFIDSMMALDSRYFRNIFALVTPNVTLKQEYYCDDCDYSQEMEVPLTTDFFWPQR